VTFDNIVSIPSEIVKVITKALPMKISNLQTTTDLPKKVNLTWDKSQEEDFSLYHLYRADSVDGSYELIATLHNNNYTDKIEEDGKTYFYKVSAVDIDGLESKHDNTIAGKTLVRPVSPALVEAKLVGNHIEIIWSNSDPRVKSYTLRKKEKKGWFDAVSEDIVGIKSQKYIDKKIVAGATYFYVVYAVDKYKIFSQKTIEVQVKVPESDKIIPAKTTESQESAPIVEEINVESQGEVATPAQNLDLDQL
jgi:fibronectin type 3 domain-containing protein